MDQRPSVAVSCGVGHRRGSDPVSLWLWCRPAAAAVTQPLAWEHSYVAGAALKKKKKRKGKEEKVERFSQASATALHAAAPPSRLLGLDLEGWVSQPVTPDK